jgi:predicted GIY-YIG superfamily endonuclease
MPAPKTCVYILRSKHDPARYYTGLTSHLPTRLAAHNAGECRHTAFGAPWEVDVLIEFSDEDRAVRFEKYLKSGSGVAFATRHLRQARAESRLE